MFLNRNIEAVNSATADSMITPGQLLTESGHLKIQLYKAFTPLFYLLALLTINFLLQGFMNRSVEVIDLKVKTYLAKPENSGMSNAQALSKLKLGGEVFKEAAKSLPREFLIYSALCALAMGLISSINSHILESINNSGYNNAQTGQFIVVAKPSCSRLGFLIKTLTAHDIHSTVKIYQVHHITDSEYLVQDAMTGDVIHLNKMRVHASHALELFPTEMFVFVSTEENLHRMFPAVRASQKSGVAA